MNDYLGNVVITGSTFSNINTCGAIIRNKASILTQTFTPSGSNDFYTYYLMRSSQFLTQQLTTKYAPITNPVSGCSSMSPCQSIKISNTTFSNFGTSTFAGTPKTKLTAPVTVSSTGGMQYTGMVLDLDAFAGSVSISNSKFTKLGPLY